MKKTALAMRCVPRFGFENTEVRTIDLDLPAAADENTLREAVTFYFASRGIADALYDLAVDDYGFFAIVNDEAFDVRWGQPVL